MNKFKILYLIKNMYPINNYLISNYKIISNNNLAKITNHFFSMRLLILNKQISYKNKKMFFVHNFKMTN